MKTTHHKDQCGLLALGNLKLLGHSPFFTTTEIHLLPVYAFIQQLLTAVAHQGL